jgi:hypothetical protein
MPLPVLSMRSFKKPKMGKNRASSPPPAQQQPQRPKQRVKVPVLKLDKRTKSRSPIETHLAPAFQFQLLEDHHFEENHEDMDERHSLDSSLRADPPPSPPKSSPHNSNHSLPILEVWMDPNDSPPSPMKDDVYSIEGRPSEPASANKQVDQFQKWDAQRLVRVILGNTKKSNAASSDTFGDEPLESGAILQAIRAYAGVKQQLQQLQEEKLELAAALEASQQSQHYDRSGVVLAAKKIQSLERELSESKKRIQELETLERTTTTASMQKEATPKTSPSSSPESSTGTMMLQSTPEDHSNNDKRQEDTTSTRTPGQQPPSSVVSLEQVLEMQTKHQETLETCQEKVHEIFLELATLRERKSAGRGKKNKPELSQQQAEKIRDQLQSFIHTIARQQSQQEIQGLQVQLVQQDQSHYEQLWQAALQLQLQLASSSTDDSPESELSPRSSAFCTPTKKTYTSTSTSTTPTAQSDLELVLYQLNSVPADQVPTPEKHKIRSHVVQLLQRMTENQTNKDIVRLTQELQSSQMTVESLTSQLDQTNQQLERQQEKHLAECETYLQQMPEEQVQEQQWSQLQQDLETAKDSLQSQSQNAHTREFCLQQTIAELESQINESVAQFEVCSVADPMVTQRDLILADQSFDEATKELAVSQTRIEELQTLLAKASEQVDSGQDQIEIYLEDKAREARLTQELQLQIGSLQAQMDDTTTTTTLQNNNQSTRSSAAKNQAKNAQMAELLQKHEQMQDAQVQLESNVVRVMESFNASQAAQRDNWLWKERDSAVARASGLSSQLAEQRAKMDALLLNHNNHNDENKRPLLATNNNHDSDAALNETPRELAQLAMIRNLTSKVEQLQEQTREQTETATLLRGALQEVQSQKATPDPTHVWQEWQTTQKMWGEYDTLCKKQSLEQPPLILASSTSTPMSRTSGSTTSTAQVES